MCKPGRIRTNVFTRGVPSNENITLCRRTLLIIARTGFNTTKALAAVNDVGRWGVSERAGNVVLQEAE